MLRPGWGGILFEVVTYDGLWWVMDAEERFQSIGIGSLTETAGTIGYLLVQ